MSNNKMRARARWLAVAAVLALAQSASVAVQAQFFWNWNQQDQHNRQRSRPQSGGLFDWFGGGQYNSRPTTTIPTVRRASDNINRNNSQPKAPIRRRRKN